MPGSFFQRTIGAADPLVFVGFGYAAWNLGRLTVLRGPYPVRWKGSSKYFGTAFEVDSARIGKLRELSSGLLRLMPSKVDVNTFAKKGLWEQLLE